jgi:hypothetical protein
LLRTIGSGSRIRGCAPRLRGESCSLANQGVTTSTLCQEEYDAFFGGEWNEKYVADRGRENEGLLERDGQDTIRTGKDAPSDDIDLKTLSGTSFENTGKIPHR